MRTLAALLTLTTLATPSVAQIPGAPAAAATYLDDSTRAAETLAQLDELIRAGSLQEASRALQTLLDLEADRLLPDPADPDLFRPVRDAVHRALLDRPDLLAAYREQQQPKAAAMLDAGNHAAVERSRFLTTAGLEATLRVAQQRFEDARFDAAWRTLAQLDPQPKEQPDRQPEAHPDLRSSAAPAAALARAIAAYQAALATSEAQPDTQPDTQPDAIPAAIPASEAARRWAALAGISLADLPVPAVPSGLREGIRPPVLTDPPTAPDADLLGVVPTPLADAALPIADPWAAQPERAAPSRRLFWSFPAILDALTIINDGEAVTAYDRFTLRQRWQYPENRLPNEGRGDADRSRGRTRLIEDPATVTVHRDLVLAPMGNVINGRREGDASIVALDRTTGTPRWRTRPDMLLPELETASVRGPIAVYADTALVMLRRNERARRTITTSLVALDLRDGSLRWHRFLGAVGALPYQQQTRSPQAISVIDGAAYLTDEVGLIAAIDAEDGAPLWIRRAPALTADESVTRPWATHAPVPLPNRRLATITPDRAEILALDRERGTIIERRPTPSPGAHAYLLPFAKTLAIADATGVSYYDPADLNRSAFARTQIPPTLAPAVGRAAATATSLYIPVDRGVLRVLLEGEPHPAGADRPPPTPPTELLSIDHAGNIDIAEGQVITADDTRLRTYLAWETASAILTQRAEADPTNPEHAVSFAELAYRARQSDEIVPAVDRAIAAINAARRGTPGNADPVADRLFETLLDIVNTAHDTRDASLAAAGGEPLPGGIGEPPVLTADLTESLIDRIDRLADSPAQRVAHLLASGRQAEQTALADEAAGTYQRILDDPVLSATPWRGQRLNIRAEIEATRRLIRVARAQGPAVYAAFAQQADAELQSLTESPPTGGVTPDDLDRLARRFPIAQTAIRARIAQADLLRGQGLDRDALIAGNAALDAVRRLQRAGVEIDDALLGTAFGLHIAALADGNRTEEAASLLAEFSETHPGITLRDSAGPIDADSLFATITQRLAARRTGPRLGPEILAEDEPQLIKGYPLRPLARPEPRGVARARYDGVLFVAKQGGTLAWHAPTDDDGPLSPVWTREIDRDPVLLRTDEVSAWLFWPDETGGWLERTDLADGKPLWTSRPWIDLAAGIDAAADDAFPDRFLDPLAGRVRSSELLIATGARTLVFIERAGRVAAIDAATGRDLWSRQVPVTQVHDADLAAGILAIAGSGPDARGELAPALAILDPRTGETINTDDRLASPPRWVRVTEAGDVVTGLRERILSLSPFDAGLNWEIADEPLFETREAWLNGPSLLVRATDDSLWTIDTVSGQLADRPLETRGRIDAADRIVVHKTPTRLILAAADGVCVFGNDNALKGLDAFAQPARLLPAVVAEDTIAVLKIERGRFGIGGTRFAINLLSHGSARITHERVVRLFGDPADMQAIDGRLLINAGDLTAVVRAPLLETDETTTPE